MKTSGARFKVGDAVSFTHEGREVLGSVVDIVEGTYIVEAANTGQAYPRKAGELHSASQGKKNPKPPPSAGDKPKGRGGGIDFLSFFKGSRPGDALADQLFDQIKSGELPKVQGVFEQMAVAGMQRGAIQTKEQMRELAQAAGTSKQAGVDYLNALMKKSPSSEGGSGQAVQPGGSGQAARDAEPAPRSPKAGPSSDRASSLDRTQVFLDGVGVVGDGVVPGAGVAADGANTLLSLWRAIKDKGNRGKHLFNAGVSAVSMIPFAGDMAKGLKYGGKALGGGLEAVSRNQSVNREFRSLARHLLDAGRLFPSRGGEADGGGGDGGMPPSDPPDTNSNDPGDDGDEDPLSRRSSGIRSQIAGFAGAVGKVSVATIAAANSLNLLNKAAVEYHRNLAKYNGVLAESYGKLEADRAQRAVREGRELSGALSGLVRSQSNLEEKLQDFQTPWKVIGSDIATGFTDLMAIGVQIVDFLEPISEIYVKFIRPKLEQWGLVEKSAKQMDSTGWIGKVRQRAEDNAKRPRKV